MGTRRGDAEIAAEETAHDGEPGAAGLLRSGDRGSELSGGEPADGAHSATDLADCAGRCARVYLRRKRSRQGSCLAHDSPAFQAANAAFYKGELRGAAGRIAGIGTFRL